MDADIQDESTRRSLLVGPAGTYGLPTLLILVVIQMGCLHALTKG